MEPFFLFLLDLDNLGIVDRNDDLPVFHFPDGLNDFIENILINIVFVFHQQLIRVFLT